VSKKKINSRCIVNPDLEKWLSNKNLTVFFFLHIKFIYSHYLDRQCSFFFVLLLLLCFIMILLLPLLLLLPVKFFPRSSGITTRRQIVKMQFKASFSTRFFCVQKFSLYLFTFFRYCYLGCCFSANRSVFQLSIIYDSCKRRQISGFLRKFFITIFFPHRQLFH
jgi:hypothetical protein